MTIKLKEHERIDNLERNGYQIIQDSDKFCFGMDAVLLSGFAKVKPGGKGRKCRYGKAQCPFKSSGK